jgi:Ca2+-binding RTX toxin-like protein
MPWNWIYGTNGNDSIGKSAGVTNGDEVIHGYGGNDHIYGLEGNDWLIGGSGADFLDGGLGSDTADYADSQTGVMVSLLTGTGIGGTAQGDTLVSIEHLVGTLYDDIFIGDAHDNWLDGGWHGNDILNGGGGNDTLVGGYGDDLLKGGGGADHISGGFGIDTAAYNESDEGVFVSLMSGTGTGGDAQGDVLINMENLTGSEHDDRLWGDDNANELRGMGGNDSLKGYGGADALWGGDGHDSLLGMDGNDTLRGEAGNDILNGGGGADTMIGGYGNDTYTVDHLWDVVTESGGQGIDEVRTSVSWTLTAGADVETLRTTNDAGLGAINLTGNSSGNVVRGNNGNNVINGGAGNDYLTGLGGQDSFLFNTALDAATNVDVITDFNVADDTILLDQDIFSSSLGLGNISAGEFVIGTAAQDANDRIIYDSDPGALYYDSDGNGGTAAIQFATLNTGLGLTYLDFFVV